MTDFLRQLRLMTTIMRSRRVLDDDPEVGHFPDFSKADNDWQTKVLATMLRNTKMSGRSRQCRNKTQNLGINKNAKRRRSILPNYSHRRLDYPTKTTAIDFLSHFRHFTTKNFSDRTTNFKYECSRKFLSTIPNRWEWDSI